MPVLKKSGIYLQLYLSLLLISKYRFQIEAKTKKRVCGLADHSPAETSESSEYVVKPCWSAGNKLLKHVVVRRSRVAHSQKISFRRSDDRWGSGQAWVVTPPDLDRADR